ncbi:MAG: hypothetical protein HY823_09885 [Acidobacteria bacterium]|nr:hypothetical protein [Acidobacteriota bacterium]
MPPPLPDQEGPDHLADGGPEAPQEAAREPREGTPEEVPGDRTENLDAFSVFKRAKLAYFRCEYDRALGYVNYAIGIDPEQREFYKLKVSILNDSPGASTGTVRTLVAALEKMIRLDPTEIDAVLQMAELYESMKMPTKAARYWQMAKSIDPQHSKLLERRNAEEETLPGVILREATDLGSRAKDKALEWMERFRR